MDKQTSRFDPQYIDEQIVQMRQQAGSSTSGASLIEDLYGLHDEDLQIRDRVWARLSRMVDASREQQTQSRARRGENPLNIAEYRENVISRKESKIMEENTSSWGMHPPMSIAESKKRRPSVWRTVSIGLIAAVALITIVSFTVFSGVLRPAPQTTSNKSTVTGSQNHSQQQSQQQQSQQQKVITSGKQVCSLNAGEKVSTNGAPWSADVNWSAQGQLAVTTYNGVKVYSTKDCKATAFSQPQIQQAYRPVWSPDGSKLLVSNGGDMGDYVLDSNGKIITKLKDHFFGDGLWSSDGKKIIFTQGDQAALTNSAEMPKTFKVSIKAVDFTNGNKVTTVAQLPDNYNVQSFLPGGKLALLAHVDQATWNKDKTKIAVWDINAGKLMTSDVVLPDLTQGYDYQLSPDGSLIALDQEGKIDIYTTADGKLLTSFENKVTGKGEHTLAWSPDGKYLAESANTIKIFDMTAKKLATTFGQVDAQHWITTLVWSPDGTGIATSSMVLSNDQPSDLTVNVWALR